MNNKYVIKYFIAIPTLVSEVDDVDDDDEESSSGA
jgi:hypothetical protein